ncbi:MAG TPA: hypothetical protein VGM82_24460 [Gemmatimonadaceae bacterium]|jgi:hypothetical protein
MSTSRLSQLIATAREERWCTKRLCTTCDASAWRAGLEAIANPPAELARELALLPLADWYDLPELNGAIFFAFRVLRDRELIDQVLNAWIAELPGHYRIADAVVFQLIRADLPSEGVSRAWLRRAEEMALESGDPSLIETLVYAFGPHFNGHVELVRIANEQRRGHAPLDRALKRVAAIGSQDTSRAMSNPFENTPLGRQVDEELARVGIGGGVNVGGVTAEQLLEALRAIPDGAGGQALFASLTKIVGGTSEST